MLSEETATGEAGRLPRPPLAEAPRSDAPRQIEAVQVLRFLAAFLVVLYHVGGDLATTFQLGFNPFLYGSSGVDVFFVISGFIIAFATRPGMGTREFVVRRIARIVPLYWLLTTGVIVLALALPRLLGATQINGLFVVTSYLFIPHERADGSIEPILFLGWTLCYEAFFYALFALGLSVSRRPARVAALLIGAFVAVGLLLDPQGALGRFYTNAIMLEFVFGMALHHLYVRYAAGLRHRAGVSAFLILLGLVAYWAGIGAPRALGQGVPAALIVAGALVMPAIRWPAWHALGRLGDASYSLYLSHPYALQVFVRVLGRGLPSGLAAALLVPATLSAVLLSVVLYRYCERPSQKLVLRWLAPRRTLPRTS